MGQLSPLYHQLQPVIGRGAGHAQQRRRLVAGDGTLLPQPRHHLVLAAHPDGTVQPQVPQRHVVQSAADQRRPHQAGQPRAVVGLAGARRRQDVLRLRPSRPQVSQNALHTAGQRHLPVRESQNVLFQVHLFPPQGHDLVQLQSQLPRQPQRRAGGRGPLRLQQLPQGEFFELRRGLPPDTGGDLLLLQMSRKVDIHGCRLHARDAGDVLPVVLLQLPQHEVVPQVDEPHGGLALRVQRLPGQTGDGLRRQGFFVPV